PTASARIGRRGSSWPGWSGAPPCGWSPVERAALGTQSPHAAAAARSRGSAVRSGALDLPHPVGRPRGGVARRGRGGGRLPARGPYAPRRRARPGRDRGASRTGRPAAPDPRALRLIRTLAAAGGTRSRAVTFAKVPGVMRVEAARTDERMSRLGDALTALA